MINLDSHTNIKNIITEYVPNDLHIDVIELKNNKVVVITDTYVEIYDSIDDWNEGEILSRGLMVFPEQKQVHSDDCNCRACEGNERSTFSAMQGGTD